jgi:hypothetical protein
MKLAAYISQGSCFVAKFGNWKWLYEDIPNDAEWVLNDKGGKAVSVEEIDRHCADNETEIHTHRFSDDRIMDTLFDRK